MTIILLLLTVCLDLSAFSQQSISTNNEDYWELSSQKGFMKGQRLRFKHIFHPSNKYHSCYEIECLGNSCAQGHNATAIIQICYPALAILGLQKSGADVMYNLLSKFSGIVQVNHRATCPWNQRLPLWKYFNLLPKINEIDSKSIIIDSCSDINALIKMRINILHNPKAYYIVSSFF
jgi:hypothetical protein